MRHVVKLDRDSCVMKLIYTNFLKKNCDKVGCCYKGTTEKSLSDDDNKIAYVSLKIYLS